MLINTFVLLASSVFLILAGVAAGKISKKRRFRAVIGILAPMLMLSALYVIVEMVVGGYEETASVSASLAVENYLFPRYAFTAFILSFVLLTAWSVFALVKRDKINALAAFSVGVLVNIGVCVTVAVLSFSDGYSEHGAIIAPCAVISAIYGIFALANTLLGTDKKLHSVILYAVNIISAVVAGVIAWFVFSAFAAEAGESGIDAVVIIFAVLVMAIIAGPIAVGLITLIGDSVSGYKYIKKEDKREPDKR